MSGLYVGYVLMCVLVVWAIVSVRSDYASLQTLTGSSVVIVWAAYLVHASIVIWAVVLRMLPLPIRPALAIPLGIVLTSVGLAIATAGIVHFRSIQRMSGLKADKLITKGIYAWSRNPQNLGWGLVLLGITVIGSSGFAILLLILFAMIIHAYIVFLEEPYLEKVYGETYRHYRSQTKRYVGFRK